MPKGSGRPPERSGESGMLSRRRGPVPKLPAGDWTKAAQRWWRLVWTSEWSSVYRPQDQVGLERLLVLVDRQARTMGGECGWDGLPLPEMSAAQLAAMASLEDRYGLSPRARQVLGWDRLIAPFPAGAAGSPSGDLVTGAPAGEDPRRAALRAV